MAQSFIQEMNDWNEKKEDDEMKDWHKQLHKEILEPKTLADLVHHDTFKKSIILSNADDLNLTDDTKEDRHRFIS